MFCLTGKGELVDIPKDIVLKAAEGDLQAFEYIYKHTSAFVYGVALRVVRNRADAQEVTQEVFLKLYKSVKQFKFQSAFKTWIYRITVNTALNFLRKEKNSLKRQTTYNDTMNGEVEPHRIERLLEQRDTEKKVNSILDALPIEQRICIVLREIQGLRYEEISEALELNINTVKSRLKRARETLIRNELQKKDIVTTVPLPEHTLEEAL